MDDARNGDWALQFGTTLMDEPVATSDGRGARRRLGAAVLKGTDASSRSGGDDGGRFSD
ncbi:uncharacterized protein DS421_16g542950 [Arachis hypogaea]|nr:uncharacterized protein DS421_16g542950 [Arachis hypogaea]